MFLPQLGRRANLPPTVLALLVGAPGILGGAFGCTTQTESEQVGSIQASLLINGCDQGTRVGVPSRGRSCPAPGPRSGWTVSNLFQQSAAITANGQPFCLYQYTGSPSLFSTAGLPADPGNGAPGDQWTDADCLGVIALNATPTELVTSAHVSASHAQMGRPSELPSIAGLPAPIRVAVLDSSETSNINDVEPTTGEFLHGRAVSMVNREHACPEGRAGGVCIPDFDTYLVLDQGGDAMTPGGHYGRMSSLATALEEAVVEAAGEQLVIPLALGWHPRFQHRDGDPLLPEATTVQAVRAALDYAACQGALVLAAAGNKTSAGEQTGALCPACWETSTPSCDNTRPLVYAVGAVTPTGEPLPTSRQGGQPPLVAAGQAVSADNRVENVVGPALGSWTGTSMGVAHIGAIATIAWGYRPNLNAKSIMALVRDSGRTIAAQADFCFESTQNQPCPSVVRATACGLLGELFAEGSPVCTNGGCPEDLNCEENPSAEVTLSAETVNALVAFTNPDDLLNQSLNNPITSSCTNAVYGDGVFDQNQNYCPWESSDSYADAPFSVDPQPGSNPCGVCALLYQQTLQQTYMDIDKNLVGFLTEPTLYVPNYGNIALSDNMQSKYLFAGDQIMVPHGTSLSNITLGKAPTLSFVWYEYSGAKPVVLSVEIPIYKI